MTSVVLPVHAQTSAENCTRDDIPGTWQLEIFGQAATNSQITFHADGSADHSFINAWGFANEQLIMTQGIMWVMTGTFGGCKVLSGTYINIFTVPPLGNVIVRRGDWTANKLGM